MTRDRKIALAYAGLFLVMLLWAGNSIVGRAMRDEIPPFTLALGRWVGSALIIAPFALRAAWADRREMLRAWRLMLFFGLVGIAGFNAFLYTALHSTTASNGLLLQALVAPLVLLFDRLFFAVRAGFVQAAGMLLSALGVALVVFRADLEVLLGARFGIGDVLILCGVSVWALYTSLLRLRPPVAQSGFLFVCFLIAASAMVPFAAMEADAIRAITWQPSVFLAFVYVALCPSAIAYYLYNVGVAILGPFKAGQLLNLMPLFGAGLAALLLGEPLHGYHFAGMLLIGAGILVVARGAPRTASHASTADASQGRG